MQSLGYINEIDFEIALNEPITATFNGIGSEVEADYLAEQIRRYMIQNYGLSAYKEGYEVFSTLNSSNQAAAVISLRNGIESPAPSFVVDNPATLLANSKHSLIGFSLNKPNAKPPLKASPAPVVSMALTEIAFK